MHSAPAVTYPVGRSSFQVWLLCLTGLASVLVGLLWQYQGGPIGWRHGLYALTAVVCGFFAFRAWRLTPDGNLRWDGQTWSCTARQLSVSGMVTVHFDLQFCMVLSLRSGDADRIWLWPERRRDPVRWNALRRAVYSHAAADPLNAAGAAVETNQARLKS